MLRLLPSSWFWYKDSLYQLVCQHVITAYSFSSLSRDHEGMKILPLKLFQSIHHAGVKPNNQYLL